MKLFSCKKCGNTKSFREFCTIEITNYYEQKRNLQIIKVHDKENNADDSRIFCDVCNEEISEDYHLFIDRYIATLFVKETE